MTLLVTEKDKKPNKVFDRGILWTDVCYKRITLVLCSKVPEGKQRKVKETSEEAIAKMQATDNGKNKQVTKYRNVNIL